MLVGCRLYLQLLYATVCGQKINSQGIDLIIKNIEQTQGTPIALT
jgi:hypothetical protein